MHRVGFLVFVVMVSGILAQFHPIMTVDNCSQRTLILTLVGASDTGIVYIQGSGTAACKQPTSSGTTQHSIDFTACGMSLDTTFKVVIQKNAVYETGEDIHIPVMCVADLSGNLTVVDSVVISLSGDGEDDSGQNKTVKPTATMQLYKDGVDVSGGSVKLTDSVTMIILLDDDYIQDFDIRARECSASTITITQTYCSEDPDLFPQFHRVGQGELSVTFGAFRTTDLNGGYVTMPFTCMLDVCLGTCPGVTTCADGSTGHGRKRRFADKRGASGIDDITVGLTISVVTEEVVLEGPGVDEATCMGQSLFVAIVATLVGGAAASAVGAGVMFKKLQRTAAMIKSLRASRNRGLQQYVSGAKCRDSEIGISGQAMYPSHQLPRTMPEIRDNPRRDFRNNGRRNTAKF